MRVIFAEVRWQSAATLGLFFGVGYFEVAHALHLTAPVVFSLAALALGYSAMASLNDLEGELKDRLNHAGDRTRPLVGRWATRGHVKMAALASAAGSLACAFAAGAPEGVLAGGALIMYSQYSARPLLICRRPYLTPLYLPFGYTTIPFLLGALSAGGRIEALDPLPVGALYGLFMARTLLKDLRDRVGDAVYHKPTIALLHGKATVLALSVVAFTAGVSLLTVAMTRGTFGPVDGISLLAPCLIVLLLGITYGQLARAEVVAHEVHLAGMIGRLSNGLLLSALGGGLLAQAGATPDAKIVFAVLIAGIYVYVAKLGMVSEPAREFPILADGKGVSI